MSVRKIERLDEFSLRQFVGSAFDHDDVVFGPDVNEIEIALLALGVSGIGDELTVNASDANRADRSGKGDVGDGQGSRGSIQGEDIGIVFTISAQEKAD